MKEPTQFASKHRGSFNSEDEKTTIDGQNTHKSTGRKHSLPDLDEGLTKIMAIISSSDKVYFRATLKSSRGLHNGRSERRSRYVGVLRNGTRWQVLINVDRKKRYIGTYNNEVEAAIVYDFYSLGLNGSKARTNFSYKNELLSDMIMSYYNKEKVFEAFPFIDRVDTTD